MSPVEDPDLRSDSPCTEGSTDPPSVLGVSRAGETSGERRIRLLRTVLGDLREPPEG
jgi:hypothetical protein